MNVFTVIQPNMCAAYDRIFKITYANGTTNFPNLGLVRTVKIVMCANDSLHGACFPTVFLNPLF